MIPPDQTSVARLIVRPPNWLGDAVLALPAIAALRRHFTAAHLTVAAVPGVAPLFRLETDAAPDAVLVLDGTHRAVIRQLRSERAELCILFPNSFRAAWQARRAGVAQRWGYASTPRGWLLTRRSVRPVASRGVPMHHVDFYRHLVRGLGIPVDDGPPVIRISAGVLQQGRARVAQAGGRVDRFVLCAPGAAYGQAKQWPPARVAEVVARLARDREVDAVLVGAAHDREAGRAVERWLAAHAPQQARHVINLIGRTDLAGLAALSALARVCLTNDSGAMHVAAAMGRPVVALFGPTDERVTRPVGRGDVLTADVFCRPCHLRDCPIDHRCMKRLTVDTVFAAVSRHLAFSGAAS